MERVGVGLHELDDVELGDGGRLGDMETVTEGVTVADRVQEGVTEGDVPKEGEREEVAVSELVSVADALSDALSETEGELEAEPVAEPESEGEAEADTVPVALGDCVGSCDAPVLCVALGVPGTLGDTEEVRVTEAAEKETLHACGRPYVNW